MSGLRVTQHRPKREQKDTSETKLKKEVSELRKTVARLRRQLEKRTEVEIDAIEDESAPQAEAQVMVPKTEKCPDCGGETKALDLAGRNYVICNECQYRKRAA